MTTSIMSRKQGGALLPLAIGAAALAAVGWGVSGFAARSPAPKRAPLVYSPAEFGGYVPADRAVRPSDDDPLAAARSAYYAGRWADAEQLAGAVTAKFTGSADPAVARRAALGAQLAAWSAARRGDLLTARERFGELRNMAAALPGHGAQQAKLGETPLPTIEEEGAFQHAVCTAGLDGAQGKRAAEAEYQQFLTRYPQSVLIHATVKRIALLHGGDLPRADEALWSADMRLQHNTERAKQREESLCGPQCLAELLRRGGKPAEAHALADEMQTSEQGSTMAAMAHTAARHGLALSGLAVTERGLDRQPLPAIALVSPGHYVLLERIAPDAVSAWDPGLHGPAGGGERAYSRTDWNRLFMGTVLARR
jgi:predicted double-glycine peptidase